MADPIDSTYFADRATQSKDMAARAATPAARQIHLELAADYERKADARVPAAAPDAGEAC